MDRLSSTDEAHSESEAHGSDLKADLFRIAQQGEGHGGIERANENVAPFVLRLTADDEVAFGSVMQRFSLFGIVGNMDALARMHQTRVGQGTRTPFSEAEQRIVEELSRLASQQLEHGRDLGQMNLQFRWVSAKGGLSVDQLITEAREHGGNPPGATGSWAHIGRSVVDDFMTETAGDKQPGVLFIYDGSKFRPISRDDMDADWENPRGRHSYMHGQVPLDGLQLKDTLIGMISFGAPGDHQPEPLIAKK